MKIIEDTESVTFKSESKKIQIFKSNSSSLSILERLRSIGEDVNMTSDEKTNALKKILE